MLFACAATEKHQSCPHLPRSFKSRWREPLHIRFEDSLWNKLCLMAFKRHGIGERAEEKGEKEYISTAEEEKFYSL